MGHIVSLQWNQMGNSLLSCGSDKVVVWDINTVGSRQEFSFHSGITLQCSFILVSIQSFRSQLFMHLIFCYSARILDADWRNNISFATCSADRKIHVCEVGLNRPYKTFLGHRVCSHNFLNVFSHCFIWLFITSLLDANFLLTM